MRVPRMTTRKLMAVVAVAAVVVWGFQRDGFAALVWEIPALGSLLAWTVRKRRRTVAAVLDSDQITGIILRADPPGLEGRVERLRKLKLTEPSAPLVLHLADGHRFAVAAAEQVGISPDGRAVSFFGEGESFEVLDADQITDIEPGPSST